MNDFLIQFGKEGDARRLENLLRDRPGVRDHAVHSYEFPWGRVAIQPPVARGYSPLHTPPTGTLVACVGRPRFMGVEHERLGESGFTSLFRDKLHANPKALSDSLTGMFAAFECSGAGARVLTDQMGFMPVYVGRDTGGRVVAIGTHLDSVAELAGRRADFDPVSLGDLLVNQYVAHPYTTRRGVTQLEPCSLSEFAPGTDSVRTTVFWEPVEPGGEIGSDQLEAELEQAVRSAAADVARGVTRAGLTLSGGLDSRLVLALLREHTAVEAVTYATRENRELATARRVARAAGVPHHVAWRREEFYAELMPRAVGLLGTELRGECHGFAVVDNGLDRTFDVIVGGFLSDTLFKGHYLTEAARERIRRRSLAYRARRTVSGAARAIGVLPTVKPKRHYFDVARDMAAGLRPDVREAVEGRRRARMERVAALRPESAEEWVRFWPAARCDGSYGPQANTRLFTADELFMHRRVVEVAARVPLHEKLGGRLTRRVFPRLYGELGDIETPAGVPANAKPRELRRRRFIFGGQVSNGGAHANGNGNHNGKGNGTANGNGHVDPSSSPWNNVEHSWVDYVLLQKYSPTWATYRKALAQSPALDVMDDVLAGGVRPYVEAYRDEAGFLFNRAALQLTYAIDRAVRRD